eukprot:5782909-Pleurochrysis_carterae.AAC.1
MDTGLLKGGARGSHFGKRTGGQVALRDKCKQRGALVQKNGISKPREEEEGRRDRWGGETLRSEGVVARSGFALKQGK